MTELSKIKDDVLDAIQDTETKLADTELWSERISQFIKALEESHQQAVADVAAIVEPYDKDLSSALSATLNVALAGGSLADHTDSELGFVLHWLTYPPTDLTSLAAEMHPDAGFNHIWNAFLKALPTPLTTPDHLSKLQAISESDVTALATSDGTIIGFGKYEQLDPGWAWTAWNRLLNWWDGISDFAATDTFEPIDLVANDSGTVRIAIIGDWGTGTFDEAGSLNPDGPAAAVMQTVVELAPDYIIHVGDTYYAGTNDKRPPKGEEKANLVDIWAEYTEGKFPAGRFFTLNSNHEMYGGAYGLYDVALSNPLFKAQQGLTYFSLKFGKWLIGCFDSAYFSPSVTYLLGGLGSETDDPAQYKFLSEFKAYADDGNMNTMLMCHHNPIDTFATKLEGPLWANVTNTITPDYWYWGHIHMGAIYSDNAPIWKTTPTKTKARCIGHSAIPIAVPWGFEKPENKNNVDWYAQTPLDGGTDNPPSKLPVEKQPRIKNGFAIITLHADGNIKEEAFDMGNTAPIWVK